LNTCPFCASSLKMIDTEKGNCDFCGYRGKAYRDGERIKMKRVKGVLDVSHAEKSLPELKKYHTLDLIILLRYWRETLDSEFNQLRLLNDGLEAVEDPQQKEEIKTVADNQGNVYASWKRRKWVLENILKQRLGYLPREIKDQSYDFMERQYARSDKNRMKISVQKRKKNNA